MKVSKPRKRRGHQAHKSMGLPKGNPLAGGGNYGRRGGAAGAGRRRTTRRSY